MKIKKTRRQEGSPARQSECAQEFLARKYITTRVIYLQQGKFMCKTGLAEKPLTP